MSQLSPLSAVFFEDCMRGMASYPDKHFDLAPVDPEWGRGEDGGKDRGSFVRQRDGSLLYVPGGSYAKKDWDAAPAPLEYFQELFRVSKHQIIWGCNYFPMVFGPGRIIWDKCNDGSDQSGAEIAYNSLTDRVDMFRFMWRGMFQGKSIAEGHIQQGNKKLNEKRIHPAQKPVALYKWLLAKFAKPGWRILDTHMGSQSLRIAAYDLGFHFVGYENDRGYFDDGCDRFGMHIAQLRLALDPDLYTTPELD